MKKRLLPAILGIIVALNLLIPAQAGGRWREISVYSGLNFYVDDVAYTPRDANGDPVDVFSYQGTTYLPARAISDLFGKEIQWDGETDSVYLGEHKESGEKEHAPVVLYIVRHGKTLFNTLDIVQGIVDSPLTNVGQEQADAVGIGLSSVKFSAAYASDLGRQRETAARILFQNTAGVKPVLETEIGLREASFGKFEGKPSSEMLTPTFEQLGLQYGQFNELFQKVTTSELTDLVAATDETGKAETVAEVQERVKAAIDRIVEKAWENGGGNVLLVSSGGAIGDVLPALNSEFDVNGSVENCSVTILEFKDGVYTLVTRNDMSYLETGMADMESGSYPEFDYTY